MPTKRSDDQDGPKVGCHYLGAFLHDQQDGVDDDEGELVGGGKAESKESQHMFAHRTKSGHVLADKGHRITSSNSIPYTNFNRATPPLYAIAPSPFSWHRR